MIIINQPFIETCNGYSFLKSHIYDEKRGVKEDIWYSTSVEYGKYFTDDVADAFLLGVLLPAIVTGQDIIVNAAISEKLYYNIKTSVTHLLAHIWNKPPIKITVKSSIIPAYNAIGVGCGCSLGVDSFMAMLSHTGANCPHSYKITHLTYFNIGAMGYRNLENAKKSYEKDLILVKNFAKEKGLPLVCVESNFSIMYQEFDFDQSGDIRNMSTVLALQKLFSKYLYASSTSISGIKLVPDIMGDYEALLLPMISTNNTELIVANPELNRSDKIKLIANNQDVHRYLYVCWKEIIVNKNPNSPIAKIKDNHLNCTRCEKCLRTIVSLDIIGKIDAFNNIFDLPYYYSVKDKFLSKVLYNREGRESYDAIKNLIKEYNYPISIRTKLMLLMRKFKIVDIYHKIINNN